MSDHDHLDGVREAEDGRLWLDLTRRQTLAGMGSLAGVVLASLGGAQSDGNVGQDRASVGEGYHVPSTDLAQTGTCKALYVAYEPEQFPPDPPTPAVGIALSGGIRMDVGSPPFAETETIATNLAELHVVADPATVTIDKGPALVVSKQSPGIQLVVDGDRHQRSSLDGGAARVHGGATIADLPTLDASERPALGVAAQASGGTAAGIRMDL